MFKTLRWRLTVWFVLLSLVTYSILGGLGMMFFYAGLTSAIDDELHDFSEELVSTVDSDSDSLSLREFPENGLPRTMRVHHHRNPLKLLAAVQLFDQKGNLIHEYGLKGIPKLMPGTAELSSKDFSKRSLSRPIVASDGKTVGYLQIQLTTRLRDHAVEQFAETLTIIAPILLLCLGISGYFFAGKAAQPIEETFRVLRQFLSDAGHELGTPIAIISAAAENLQVQLEDTPHAARLAIISRNTDRMSRLVQDLTVLMKVDVPREALTHQTDLVSLDSLVKTCVEDFGDRYEEQGIKLVVGEIQPATINGDADSIARALVNLLENAKRYTDNGGTVTVSLKSAGKLAKVSVEDTGIGIPSDSLPHLFDRFYRVDKSRSRAQGGFGLGLSIVKAIVEQHRGYVEVASEEGKGTRFSIILPCM